VETLVTLRLHETFSIVGLNVLAKSLEEALQKMLI